MYFKRQHRGMLWAFLTPGDAQALLRIAAQARSADQVVDALKAQLLVELSLFVGQDAEYWRGLVEAQDGADCSPQIGVIMLIRRALEDPEVKPLIVPMLTEVAKRLSGLLERRGPQVASLADLDRFKRGSRL